MTTTPPSAVQATPDEELMQAVQAATSLLKAYRTHGHLAANLNPLGGDAKGDPALEPENLNLTPELMGQIPASILRIGVPGETLLDALPRMLTALQTPATVNTGPNVVAVRVHHEPAGHRVPAAAHDAL